MAAVLNRAEYLRKALSNFNLRCVAGKTLGEVTVHHPGITYSDTSSSSRYPTIWNIQRLLEGIRFFAHHTLIENWNHSFLDYDDVTQDRFTFIASAEFHIEPIMYDYIASKSPLEAALKLNHVGVASLSTTCDLSACGKPLLSNRNGVISIDKTTRKPLEMPDWWIGKYKQFAATDVAFRVNRVAHPEGSMCEQATVRWSDTDFYQHTNWASYVKFCLDAANCIAISGRLIKTDASVVQNNAVKYAKVAYVGESVIGDVLDVHTWESSKNKLEFDINKGSKPVCYCSVEYYEMDELAKPNIFVYPNKL